MRLVDFLILLLGAHAETLKRLGAFFGEEELVNLLEDAGEANEAALPPTKVSSVRAPIVWRDEPTPRSNASAYAELEGNVREFDLPEVLEFHLWAYPPYRTYIESAINLGAKLAPGGGESGVSLVEEACRQAEEWVKTLGIPPAVAAAAYKAAHVPWLRFRTETLKKMGRRPLGAVQ